MAFDVSALTNYTVENEIPLVVKSMFTGKTADLIKDEGTVMTGIKASQQIEILNTDAIFQQGGTCGFVSSGNTTFTQRPVVVGKIRINESLCPKALETKWTQKALPIGSRYDSIPFEQQYAEGKATTVAEQLETAYWQGDTASGNANLNKFDGLIKLLDAANVTNINTNTNFGTAITIATGITAANVQSIVNGMWGFLPARIQGKEDVRIFVGWDVFAKYITSYTASNLFHFAPSGGEISAQSGEIVIPGTNYKLTAVHGLDGTNRAFALRMSNLFLGTDMENEEERFEIFFAKEADEVRYINEFKAGINVAFPNEVATFKLV